MIPDVLFRDKITSLGAAGAGRGPSHAQSQRIPCVGGALRVCSRIPVFLDGRPNQPEGDFGSGAAECSCRFPRRLQPK